MRPELTVLCRSLEQLEACCEARWELSTVTSRTSGFIKKRWRKCARLGRRRKSILATPRIQKAGESGYFKIVERAEPDGVLVRNLGAIDYFSKTDLSLVGDFSLNVANPITASFFKRQGLEKLTVSYDLNLEQVLGLLGGASPDWFEITLHQHMPMFHMEHCVFCTFMSSGTDITNCGKPCEKHDVQLRDRVGQLHTLKADVGCRNTLFRGQAQTGARFFKAMRELGGSRFRVELLREDAAETRELIEAYARLLRGETLAGDLFARLGAESKLGVVEGTLL